MLDVLLACIDQIIPAQPFALTGVSLGACPARGMLYHCRDLIDGLAMTVPAIPPTGDQRDCTPHTVVVEGPGIMNSLTDQEREMMSIKVVRGQRYLEDTRARPLPFPIKCQAVVP